MWSYRQRIRFLLVACVSCFLLFHVPLFGDSYLITDSEITQIRDECATLQLELSILKELSQKDKESLKLLSESLTSLEASLVKAEASLTNTQNELKSAQDQLAEVKTQLDELKASLTRLKLAELWEKIKVGGITFSVGAAIGIIAGLIISAQ